MSSEQNRGESQPSDNHTNVDTLLEARLTRELHERAEQIHFTPQMRERIMSQLPSRRVVRQSRRLVLALALTAVLILIGSLAAYLTLPRPATAVSYVPGQSYATPALLAQQGELLSIDPTMRYIVYTPANQPGVLYTAELQNALNSNLLAMRDAHDITWAPDGSALVTTVSPQGVYLPLLALVPAGKYMHLLGHDAEAASWLPTSKDKITFVTLANNHLHLWSTTPDGQPTSALATMNISDPVTHLTWTRDGKKLALLISKGGTTGAQVGNTLYVMDAASGALQEVASAQGGSIDAVAWSPDGQYVSYEQRDVKGKITLNILAVSGQREHFSLEIEGQLQGWSWSPDSRGLIYSDSGKLKTHILRGKPIQLPAMQGRQQNPFWLSNGHIVFLQVTDGTGTLTTLVPQQS